MRYFLGFLFMVGMIVLVFVLILRGFSGPKQNKIQTKLTDYAATETVMRMTVEGPVIVDQDHRSIKVTIGRDSNKVELVKGYEGEVLKAKEYSSNQKAYSTFLRAIQLQGYLKGAADSDQTDSQGVCPTGRIYRFDIVTGSDTVQSYWTTSCGGGTFKGNTDIIRKLFRVQVPDYKVLIHSTGLN